MRDVACAVMSLLRSNDDDGVCTRRRTNVEGRKHLSINHPIGRVSRARPRGDNRLYMSRHDLSPPIHETDRWKIRSPPSAFKIEASAFASGEGSLSPRLVKIETGELRRW